MKFIIGISLIFYVSAALAQKQNIYYLNNDGRLVSTRDSADFIRIIREPDSGSVLYNVLEYYKNNAPRFIGKSLKTQPIQLDGDAISFYPNGKRKTIARYNMGLKIGSVFEYYPNGKLYFQKQYPDNINYNTANAEFDIMTAGDSTGNITAKDGEGYVKIYNNGFKKLLEQGPLKKGKRNGAWQGVDTLLKITYAEEYQSGVLKSGSATDSVGQNFPYRERTEEPQYKGGFERFYRYVSNSISYSDANRDPHPQEKAYAEFWVEKDGSVTNVKLIRAPSDDIGSKIMNVIKGSPKWIPAKHFGLPERKHLVLPIVF